MHPRPPSAATVAAIRAHRDELCALGRAHGLARMWVAGDGLMVAEIGDDPADYLAVVEFEHEAEELLDGYVAVVPRSAYEQQPLEEPPEL